MPARRSRDSNAGWPGRAHRRQLKANARLDGLWNLTTIMVMVLRRRFGLEYAPIVKDHLRAIDPKYYALIRKTIEDQLPFEPDVQTRNRKPLKRPVDFGAQWELRLGPDNRFRVFYKINHKSLKVNVLAIGEKRGARLIIGGEVIRL